MARTERIKTCSLVIFVVAAFSGGSLRDAENGKLHILEEEITRQVQNESIWGIASQKKENI